MWSQSLGSTSSRSFSRTAILTTTRTRKARGPTTRCVRYAITLAIVSSAHSPLFAVRRATLTTLNPATGKRESARNFKEFDEWVRRRESGYVSPKEEFDDGLDDLDGGASDMGDAE